MLRQPVSKDIDLLKKQINQENPREKFIAEILDLLPLLDKQCLQFIIIQFIKMAEFMHNQFSGRQSSNNLLKTLAQDWTKKQSDKKDKPKKKDDYESNDSDTNDEEDIGKVTEEKVLPSNENIKKNFKEIYKKFKKALKKLNEILSNLDKEKLKKYGLNEINLLKDSYINNDEIPFYWMINNQDLKKKYDIFKIVTILCGVQNKILEEYKKVATSSKPKGKQKDANSHTLDVRKFYELKENCIISCMKKEIEKIIGNNSFSRSKFSLQNQAKMNIEMIFESFSNKFFLELPQIDIVNLPKFRLRDKIYGEKYYLNLLIDRYGFDKSETLSRMDYFQRSRTQSNDFKEFNDLKRVIYFSLNYEKMHPRTKIKEFIRKNEISFKNISKIQDVELANLYSQYSFLEFRLIRLNINQTDHKFKNKDLTQRVIDRLDRFFKKYSKEFLKKGNLEMSFLEYWTTVIVRVISRFIGETDEDDLLVSTIRKGFHLSPEFFKDENVDKLLENVLQKSKIKNKYAVFIYQKLESACGLYLTNK